MNTALRQQRLRKCLSEARFPVAFSMLKQSYDRSERTLRRDLDTLIQDYNAPWFIHQKHVYLDPTRADAMELQEHWFTRQEVESLFALNQIIEQLSPSSLKQQLDPFKKRIQRLLDAENTDPASRPLSTKIKLIEMADRTVPPDIFQSLIQALAEHKQVKIHFWNRHTNETTQRTLSPQRLVRYKDNWLLDAHCHLRNAIRSFSLEAIQHLEHTAHTAQILPEDQLQQHFQSTYGIYAGQADQYAVIEFSEYMARWVQHENWHPNQQSAWLANGRYQLTVPYQNDTELIQDILKYGEHTQVRQPPELCDKIKQRLKQAWQQYEKEP